MKIQSSAAEEFQIFETISFAQVWLGESVNNRLRVSVPLVGDFGGPLSGRPGSSGGAAAFTVGSIVIRTIGGCRGRRRAVLSDGIHLTLNRNVGQQTNVELLMYSTKFIVTSQEKILHKAAIYISK